MEQLAARLKRAYYRTEQMFGTGELEVDPTFSPDVYNKDEHLLLLGKDIEDDEDDVKKLENLNGAGGNGTVVKRSNGRRRGSSPKSPKNLSKSALHDEDHAHKEHR